MSKHFSNGNRDGHDDGKSGDNRLAVRSAERLLHVSAYLPGAENRDAEYRRGYVAGFADEVRVHHVAPADGSQGGGFPMSQATSFAHQIELLQNLKQYLMTFQERLGAVSEAYQRKVDQLHDEGGLMDETYRDYVVNCLEPTRALIARMVEHIDESDIPAVEREIQYLEPKL